MFINLVSDLLLLEKEASIWRSIYSSCAYGTMVRQEDSILAISVV